MPDIKKTEQHPPAHFYDGVFFRDLSWNTTRSFDQSPKEIELLHGFVIREIHKLFPKGVNINEVGQHDLVQKIYGTCANTLTNTPEAQQAINVIIERYDKLPTNEDIRLAKDGSNSIVHAVIFGLIVGAVIVGAVCIYYAARY